MGKRDKCPSCGERVTAEDFLCPNCELILDASLAPAKPVRTEVSVVRRMLEAPQRGVPSAKPPSKPRPAAAAKGSEGATKVFSLPPSHSGVPIVVASLSKKALALTEFEAWVVSLIDGACDVPALAKKVGVRELEMQVVLHGLHEKMVVDFADEPLADEPPLLMGELASPVPDEDEPLSANAGQMEFDEPPIAQGVALPPPLVLEPTPPVRAAQLIPPAVPPLAAAASVPAFPSDRGRKPAAPPPRPPLELGDPAAHVSTDPRILAKGKTNQKVLDALKQVRRKEADAAPPPAEKQDAPGRNTADVLAQPTLQVALRMEQGGRFAEAIRYLEQAVARSPDAPSLYNRLAIILMRERADFRRAESLLRKAIELAPDNTVYATNLQQVLSRMAVRSHR